VERVIFGNPLPALRRHISHEIVVGSDGAAETSSRRLGEGVAEVFPPRKRDKRIGSKQHVPLLLPDDRTKDMNVAGPSLSSRLRNRGSV
jgi:hypothetical protein